MNHKPDSFLVENDCAFCVIGNLISRIMQINISNQKANHCWKSLIYAKISQLVSTLRVVLLILKA